jgi:hypothetical protein
MYYKYVNVIKYLVDKFFKSSNLYSTSILLSKSNR